MLGKIHSRRELARRVGDFSQLFGGELQILDHDDQRDYRLAITPHAGVAAINALQDRLRLPE